MSTKQEEHIAKQITKKLEEQAKPQIPVMVQSLLKQSEVAKGLLNALEVKVGSVLRTGKALPLKQAETTPEAAPLAGQLNQALEDITALNIRLRDITSRVEL